MKDYWVVLIVLAIALLESAHPYETPITWISLLDDRSVQLRHDGSVKYSGMKTDGEALQFLASWAKDYCHPSAFPANGEETKP